MKCKCGHEKSAHDEDGVCWKLIDGQGSCCRCGNFSWKPKPLRRARPFKRWSVYREMGVPSQLLCGNYVVLVLSGVLGHNESGGEIAKALNRARVVLPKRGRS